MSRLEEAGGRTRKYDRSNTRLYSYDLPEDSEETLAEARETAADAVADFVETRSAEHGDEIETVVREMTPCEYCENQHYEELVVRDLLGRALLRVQETTSSEERATPNE